MYKNKKTASDKRKEKYIQKIFDDINTLFDHDEEFTTNYKGQKIFDLLMLVSERTLKHNAKFGEWEVEQYKKSFAKGKLKQGHV